MVINYVILTKLGWAPFWAIFSQSHLVTLDTTKFRQKLVLGCTLGDFCANKSGRTAAGPSSPRVSSHVLASISSLSTTVVANEMIKLDLFLLFSKSRRGKGGAEAGQRRGISVTRLGEISPFWETMFKIKISDLTLIPGLPDGLFSNQKSQIG
jgi:hypothetical protein